MVTRRMALIWCRTHCKWTKYPYGNIKNIIETVRNYKCFFFQALLWTSQFQNKGRGQYTTKYLWMFNMSLEDPVFYFIILKRNLIFVYILSNEVPNSKWKKKYLLSSWPDDCKICIARYLDNLLKYQNCLQNFTRKRIKLTIMIFDQAVFPCLFFFILYNPHFYHTIRKVIFVSIENLNI